MFLYCPNPTGSFRTPAWGGIFVWRIDLKYFEVADVFHLL